MTILTKPIKPKKFKDDVFRKELLFAAGQTARDIKKDFEKTVKTWDNKPKFEIIVAVGPKSIDIFIGTDDEVYGYVDKGTKEHIIQPKKPGGTLAFQSQYKPKTIPNMIGSRSGGSSGETRFAKWVIHPGTKARNFSKIIKKKWARIYKRRIEKALRIANKNSGHAYTKQEVVMSDFYLAGQGSIWVQPDGPNTEPKYLGCHALLGIDAPKGDVTLYYCPDPSAPNKFRVDGSSQSAPGPVTFDIEMKVGKTADWLEKVSCPVPVYVLMNTCGRKDNFSFERAYAMPNTYITNESPANLAARNPDNQDEVLDTFSMAAEDLHKGFEMVGQQKTTSETEDLNDIASCSDEGCAGDCGEASDVCDIMVIACDAAVGATANVLRSTDRGAAWAATAADPFAADEDILSIVCFPISKDTTRILCVREADAADNAEAGYSDDNGATWTNSDIPTANNIGANHGGALFYLDPSHIWCVLDGGNIGFSSDGGATWTLQEDGTVTANDLHDVHFIDQNVGYAVGDGDTILRTLDGGDTWAAVTATGGGNGLFSVFVIDRYRVWVGDDGGDLYYTNDGGTTWTQRAFTGDGAGSVLDIEFINELFGFIIGTSSSDQLLRTIDGGYTWQNVDTPSNSGLNQMQVCNENELFAVGEDDGATGVIIKASN